MAIKNALIVDDSKSARFVLKRMLNELKLDVETVESATDALEYLKNNTPDVIFMDHMMPGMDGFEAVKHIKSNSKTAVIPIMMYTSRGGDVYLSQAKALGAVGVIPKTISPVGLKESLFKLGLVKDRRVSTSARLEPGREERRKPQDIEKDAKLAIIKAETQRLQNSSSQTVTSKPVSQDSKKVDKKENQQIEESLLRKQYEHDSYIEDLRKMMDDQTIELHKSMWLGIETVSHEIFNRLNGELQEKMNNMQSAGQGTAGENSSVTGSKISWPFLIVSTVLLASLILNVTLLSNTHRHEDTVVASDDNPDTAVNIEVNQDYVELKDNNDGQYTKEEFVIWAQDRQIEYPFDELALNENRLPSVEELIQKAVDANYTGNIILQTHVGKFCLSRGQSGNYNLAEDDLPVTQCEYIGNYMQPYDVSTTHQSLDFANYLSDLGSLNAKGIEIKVSNISRSVELSKYPIQNPKTSVAEWNLAAQLNNRITIKLEPFQVDSLVETEKTYLE